MMRCCAVAKLQMVAVYTVSGSADRRVAPFRPIWTLASSCCLIACSPRPRWAFVLPSLFFFLTLTPQVCLLQAWMRHKWTANADNTHTAPVVHYDASQLPVGAFSGQMPNLATVAGAVPAKSFPLHDLSVQSSAMCRNALVFSGAQRGTRRRELAREQERE